MRNEFREAIGSEKDIIAYLIIGTRKTKVQVNAKYPVTASYYANAQYFIAIKYGQKGKTVKMYAITENGKYLVKKHRV